MIADHPPKLDEDAATVLRDALAEMRLAEQYLFNTARNADDRSRASELRTHAEQLTELLRARTPNGWRL